MGMEQTKKTSLVCSMPIFIISCIAESTSMSFSESIISSRLFSAAKPAMGNNSAFLILSWHFIIIVIYTFNKIINILNVLIKFKGGKTYPL